jgi:hypothetical protein
MAGLLPQTTTSTAAPTWTPADASVDTQLDKILAKPSPLMRQARATGLQVANRRGLLNSSLAGQASQKALYDVAVPIASQNAAQINQTNLQQMGVNSQEKGWAMTVASNDRARAQASADQAEQTYAQLLGSITNNTNIPAAMRDKYMEHISTLRDSYFKIIEQMYGINLDWATPETPVA